jgi:hypothetical protein
VPHETQDNTQEHKPTAVELTGFAQAKVEGGSWDHHANDSKASHRYTDPPTLRDGHLGLRVARVPIGPAVAVPAPTVPERKAPGGLPPLGQFGSK